MGWQDAPVVNSWESAPIVGGAKKPPEQTDINGPKEMPMFSVEGTINQVKNMGMGALKGASRIGSTIVGTAMGDREERNKSIDQFMSENADPSSLAFKIGDVGTQIMGTAGAGGTIAKGISKIPALAKFAPVVESGGFNLGQAATSNPLANALMRGAGGAIQGGAQVGMVDPSQMGSGAMVGAIAPGAVKGAGMAGEAVGNAFNSGAKSLMQSALKPTIKQLRTGQAESAVNTLLDEGIPATSKGVEILRDRIGGLNDEISNRIANSSGQVNKLDVAQALNDTRKRFGNQVAPQSDLAAIESVKDAFMSNPNAPGLSIPVQLAQAMKQGTYKTLAGKYGEVGSASTEAQKALARGLKEQVGKAVPEILPLNAREARLLDALSVTERRALMDANKNPVGLSWLASNPAAAAAFMADRSAAFKSLAAKMLKKTGDAAQTTKALENFAPQQGLLGAPSVLTASP